MTLELTIGIPTYGREDVLVETVAGVLARAEGRRVEVIVADQTASHGEEVTRRLRQWDASGAIRYLQPDHPSLPHARNVILREARAPIVLFLDDDVRIPDGFIEAHLAPYGDPAVAAVAGQTFHSADKTTPPTLDTPHERSRPHFDPDRPAGPATRFVGCNHSVRREAAIAIGGYDEQFVRSANFEESDLAQRLIDSGHTIHYEPRAWLVHLLAPSGGCRVTAAPAWSEWPKAANFLLFALRHPGQKADARFCFSRSLRAVPLRKDNITKPWRQPGAWYSWCRAFLYALRRRGGVRSIFTTDR
mgnify:CR=1 FL=1